MNNMMMVMMMLQLVEELMWQQLRLLLTSKMKLAMKQKGMQKLGRLRENLKKQQLRL